MSTQIERRWGILAIAVLMLFVTMIVVQINGAKTSIYYWVWMMVGYYAYRANLDGIITLMKIFIFVNICALALIIPIADETLLGYLNSSSKVELILGVMVMLIPKAALYFYCKNQLEKGNNLSNDASPSASNKIYADIIYETWLGQFWNNFNAVGKICLVIILYMIIAMGFGWK